MQACMAGVQNCQRFALHPADAQQRSEHAAECLARHKRVSSHAASRLMECSICMELVCETHCAFNKILHLYTASSWAPDTLNQYIVCLQPTCCVSARYVMRLTMLIEQKG